ncbi:protein-L-isoaspartate(D-aspartate) O-methyltransferase [bacterium]|nr:protein-L-isoaspartate(D-aspartate) O-methyltransferase [bacterium]
MTGIWDIENTLELRHRMVTEQLQNRGISNIDILHAFEEVPRHMFIPNVPVNDAYGDYPIPIKAGQTISQPFIVALMLSYLELRSNHEVFEIGSGSGYATAIIAKLCRHVDALEVYNNLIRDSISVLKQLGVSNLSIQHRSAWEQLQTLKVYDRIILWASPPRIPQHLFECLSDSGILVTPEGKSDQYLWIYKKINGRITKERKDAVRFVPLVRGSVNEIDSPQGGENE